MLKAMVVGAALFALSTDVTAQDSNTLLEKAALSRAKGQVGAPVLVYEIADFQCPYCARFAREVFSRIDSAYVKTGKVQWIFVNLPLPNHGNAWAAAEAALCAGAVSDRFWPVHDRLFAAQNDWAMAQNPTATIEKMVREAGVSFDSYQACVRDDRTASLILQDVIFAATTRVNGTPTFIINNEQMVMGMKTFEEWKDLLDTALNRDRG